MVLVSMQKVSIAFGGHLLLDQVSLQIDRGERICLLGRNGEGKSTLMKMINGDVAPDTGEIIYQQGIRIAFLGQEVTQKFDATVLDVVSGRVSDTDIVTQDRLGRMQVTLETDDEWGPSYSIERMISQMSLDPNARFGILSAGMKRRVLLARALAIKPDLLLLDEPTNHLDIESIGWLEEFLLKHVVTMLFVTHDRMLLRKLAGKILELDRGGLSGWSCNYDTFLNRRELTLESEAEQCAVFDKKVAKEEVWIRQGIKARRTRSDARIRALIEMREAQRTRRKRVGSVRMNLQEAERSGKLVIKAKDVSFAYDDCHVVRGFSTVIMRGDKVGIIGPNGSGKTTLLRLLLGELVPQQGYVKHGTRMEVSYFDQLREQLDEAKTVQENVGKGNDMLTINGKQRHIIGYLQDFLFSPDRSRSPVWQLSGGERNRLLLAKLFTRPSNVIVLDEPTNDLDTETLDLLQELLLDYGGTMIVVSHDRAFLNDVVTSTLALEGDGRVGEYVGGYDDWLRQRKEAVSVKVEKSGPKSEKPRLRTEKPLELSYKERRELEALPQLIESLESEQREIYERLADPSFYQHQDGEKIAKLKSRLPSLESELNETYERWESLESLNSLDE